MEKRIRGWKLLMADADADVFVDRAACETLARTLAENLRQGAGAARHEASIERFPGHSACRCWLRPCTSLARRTRTRYARCACRATFYPQDGHFSILTNRLEEIFLALSVVHTTKCSRRKMVLDVNGGIRHVAQSRDLF
jgi:glycine/D-amino acid oxidase-like deaminating enzyme